MTTESKASVGKVKSSNQDSSSKGKPDSSSLNRKKIDNSSTKQPPKSSSAPAKSEAKSKTISSSSKSTTKTTTTTTTTKTTTKVREKKVFTLAGQKFDPPEEREPLRIFYESLSKQIPTSEMAEFWMMEHGLLSPDRAKKVHEKKLRKQKQLRMGTPTKSSQPLSNKPESSQKQQQGSKNGDLKAKRRVSNDADDDDDFILSPKRRKG